MTEQLPSSPAGPSQRGLGDLPRNLWVLTLASFLTDVSTEMIVRVIPFFLANVLGVRTAAIGLIEGVAEMTASLLKAWSGRLSDRLGRRKGLTVAGYALSTAAKPFLALARSWPAVLGVRFFERMGKGIRTAPRDALLADSVSEKVRGLAFGLHRAGDTAGAVVGLLSALIVVWLAQGDRLLLAPATFRSLVWLSVIPAALTVLLLVVGIQEQPVRGTGRPVAGAEESLSQPFKRFLLVVVLFTLGNSADAFLILRAQERGLNILGVLGLLLLFNIVYAATSGPAGALSDRLGRRRLLLAGWMLYALVYAGFALAQTAWHVALFFALYGAYYGLTEGSAKAFVADLVLPEQRGEAYGLFHAAVGVTALPASVLAGLLWQGLGAWPGLGPRAPFVFGATMAVVAAGLLVALLRGDMNGGI